MGRIPAAEQPHYRIRRSRSGFAFEKHFVGAGGAERALASGNVETAYEATREAAAAILGDHLGGDWPRAWRLVDAFERDFLAALNVMDELSIDVAAVASWVAAREQ